MPPRALASTVMRYPMKKTCIICRKPKEEFSDEHVIPDSIDGFYHIYSVCKSCNSKLGEFVDSKLVNHKFIEFQRHTLKIKGKSGQIPNPFSGVQSLKDDVEQKVTLTFNEKGELTPKLLPKIPKFKNQDKIESISFSIDEQDLHLKDQIIDKILFRNNIDKSQINFQSIKEKPSTPWVQATMAIDIKNFRIGLLKIAYEFAIDTIDEYFDDPIAIKISEILFDCDLKKMDEDKLMLGSGFEKTAQKPLSHLIDYENNNHYIILTEIESVGLVCQVNIFDCFSIWVRLSESYDYLKGNIIVGINDIENKKFEKITTEELIKRTFSKPEYRFEYFLPNREFLPDFIDMQKSESFGYYTINEEVPFFDKSNNVKYANIDLKLTQEQLIKIPKGDDINEMHTQVILDEELYLKLLPSMQLYQVVSVQIETYRINKV